jgi:hypothetical protein
MKCDDCGNEVGGNQEWTFEKMVEGVKRQAREDAGKVHDEPEAAWICDECWENRERVSTHSDGRVLVRWNPKSYDWTEVQPPQV